MVAGLTVVADKKVDVGYIRWSSTDMAWFEGKARVEWLAKGN